MVTIPVVLKDLIDKVNASHHNGILGIVQYYTLFDRAGSLVGDAAFRQELETLVKEHAPKSAKRDLHQWMQEVLTAFLGFLVEVPPPPKLNRQQTRALKRYNLWLFFAPSEIEKRELPAHFVRPVWGTYLQDDQIQRIPLCGKWVAFEVTPKPNYRGTVYPNDRLIKDLGLESRFAHPHSDGGEGDDIVTDLMPKIAGLLHMDSAQVGLASVEAWNFIANLMNFLRENYGEDLPDLGSTDSVEWVANTYGSEFALIVGDVMCGGLAYLDHYSRVLRSCELRNSFCI